MKQRKVICEFKRYERKYLITNQQKDALLADIGKRLVPDEYSADGRGYRIFNLYLDTENYDVIRRSSEKPVFKEKARFRAYTDYSETGLGYLEMKRKIRRMVVKRRIRCSEKEALAFISDGTPPPSCTDTQKINEFLWYFKVNSIKPKVYLSYDRVAYTDSISPDVRVTFDSAMLYRTDNLTLEAGDYGNSLLPEGYCVLEIKFSEAMPIWMADALAAAHIYPHSFSKYGEAYKREITSRLRRV